MRGVFDSDSGGLVDPFTKFTSETAKKWNRYLLSINLAVALRPEFLAIWLMSSRIPSRSR